MNVATLSDASAALGRFRACVLGDEALAWRLARIEEPERFVAAVVSGAAGHGIGIDADTVGQAIRPDPIGMARYAPSPPDESRWPSRHWLPHHVTMLGDRAVVDWLHVGPEPLTDPFFEASVRRAAARPFNRMFRYRMTLDDFLFAHAHQPPESLAPSGFIFHMSRCGSTLVAQMLAAVDRTIVISEAPPIDAMVQLCRTTPHLSEPARIALLRAIIATYGRRRSGAETHYFIKLDSWHALALPLFRDAFPQVPWLFLYRDPVEVLVSQVRQRGAQMVPDIVPPELYGINGGGALPDDDYCARVLGKICTAAADELADDAGGLAVDYRDLPGALWSRILLHFGFVPDARERQAMLAAGSRDAKAPQVSFVADSVGKQREATPVLYSLAQRHVGEPIRRLAALPRR